MGLKWLCRTWLGALLSVAALAGQARAEAPFIAVASTTSSQQSGLFGWLRPRFRQATGIDVRVVPVGTGQVLDRGRRGDADVVLVGPNADPAGIRGHDIAAALKTLASSPARLVSRGDRSGTHAAESRPWVKAGIDLAKSWPVGYRDRGPALTMASSMNAHTLSDRGTWLSSNSRGQPEIVLEGDESLFDQHGAVLVNPARHAQVKVALGQKLTDSLVSPEGRDAVESYGIGGEPLFFPNPEG